MTPRNMALARTFPILIGIVIFGALIVFLALRTVRGVEQSEAVAARFEGLAENCVDGGRQTADGIQASEGLEMAEAGVAFRLVGEVWLYDGAALPAAWRAQEADGVQWVLCLGPAEALVTTACAVDASGAAPTRVYGEALTVGLIAAEDGTLLGEQVLQSAAVTGCRDEVEVMRVGAELIEGWVREVVGE